MQKLIETETARLLTVLPTLEPGTERYGNVLKNLHDLIFMSHDLRWMARDEEPVNVQAAPAASLPWEEPIAPMQMPEEKSIIPKEEPIVIKHVDEVLTKDVVRARLQGASEKGVHIQPIIAKFVPEGKPVRFSSVPESEYTALVKELYDAQNK